MKLLIAYLLVAFGGAVGSVARYAVTAAATWCWGPAFPWGTIIINVVGSFIITFVGTLTAATGIFPASPEMRVLVMVGFCGGFTTFSSFSLQTLELAQSGRPVGAAANVLLSVCVCLGAAWAGYYVSGWVGAVARTES
jgi:fluoride exporter